LMAKKPRVEYGDQSLPVTLRWKAVDHKRLEQTVASQLIVSYA
jgi:hypothetical protein